MKPKKPRAKSKAAKAIVKSRQKSSRKAGSVARACSDEDAKTLICPAICKCKDQAGEGEDGRRLKQACVSKALKKQGGKAIPEVNYRMRPKTRPPKPIMSKSNPLKPASWLPAHLKDIPGFKPGKGMVRRPDVVIVKDANRRPTQSNLAKVVEIKFPPDRLSRKAERDYRRIAGRDSKFLVLTPAKCNCK